MRSESQVAIGIDVGGTKILAGQIDGDGTTRKVLSRPTPGRRVPVSELDKVIGEMVAELRIDVDLVGVTIAAAGLCASDGRFVFGPNLPWADDNVVERFGELWQLPVALDNDANCAALGEHVMGAGASARASGQPAEPLLLVTVGTGIGGGLIIGGEIFRGASGLATEFGHMRIADQTRECECGSTGCWEQLCSGNQLQRLTDGKHSGAELTRAALAGDADTKAAFAEVGYWLGVGVASLCAVLDPGLIVIGGGVSASGELLLAPARASYEQNLLAREHREPAQLVLAELGPQAGMIGAGILAHQRFGASTNTGSD